MYSMIFIKRLGLIGWRENFRSGRWESQWYRWRGRCRYDIIFPNTEPSNEYIQFGKFYAECLFPLVQSLLINEIFFELWINRKYYR
jgi:hypothetical protein